MEARSLDPPSELLVRKTGGRCYSHTGCQRCKQRKKKCNEARPVCDACERLGFACVYIAKHTNVQPQHTVRDAPTFSYVSLGPTDPARNPRLLPMVQFRAHEASVIARVPASVVRFYCITCDETTRDTSTSTLMQITIDDALVRHALVACFSTILPKHDYQLGKLDRESLGIALAMLRARIVACDQDMARLSTLLIAIMFLGLIESAGPGKTGFEMMHFLALTTVMGEVERSDLLHKLPLSRSLVILTSEAILYHYSIACLFTEDFELVLQHWLKNRVFSLYKRLLPDKKERVAVSPLLGGQYDLWRLAFEVFSLNRRLYNEQPDVLEIREKRQEIKRIRATLDALFMADSRLTRAEQQCMAITYHTHSVALLIGLSALEPPSASRDRELAALCREGVALIAKLEQVPISFAAASWGWMIIALAIPDLNAWVPFHRKVMQLRPQMDAGHARRLDIVLAQVSSVRNRPDGKTRQRLPGSLYLLQQRKGILFDRRFATQSEQTG